MIGRVQILQEYCRADEMVIYQSKTRVFALNGREGDAEALRVADITVSGKM